MVTIGVGFREVLVAVMYYEIKLSSRIRIAPHNMTLAA